MEQAKEVEVLEFDDIQEDEAVTSFAGRSIQTFVGRGLGNIAPPTRIQMLSDEERSEV